MQRWCVEDWQFELTVTNGKAAHCRLGLETGDNFIFSYECPEGICPRVMADVYTWCEVIRCGGDFTKRGEKEPYEMNLPCPCHCIHFHLKATPINRDENGNAKPNKPRPIDCVITHYDSLVEKNNDPVHDPKPLQDYMDKWDGQSFIDSMELNENKSVLEIGVGTGRLALRVAPHCREFCGIDISPKTIQRASDNLSAYENITLICDDFISHDFLGKRFDVIYSSLTFMHISEKQRAVEKIKGLLNDGGIFVLGVDKNQSGFIDMGTYKVTIFPDTPETIKACCERAKFRIINQYETEFAHIFVLS